MDRILQRYFSDNMTRADFQKYMVTPHEDLLKRFAEDAEKNWRD